MGLCINWTVHAPETASLESVTHQLRAWREACLDLPFDEVTDIVHFTEAEIVQRLDNRADPFRWFLVQASAYVAIYRGTPEEFSASVDPVEVVGFTPFAGDECEPMNCFLARYPEQTHVGRDLVKPGISGWRGSSFTKTQYASTVAAQHFLKCHLTITAALDAAKAAGILKSVLDEGGYWDDRDAEKLLTTVGQWNAMTAAFVGWLWVFTAVEHWNGELLGHHVCKRGDRLAAYQPVAQAVNRIFGSTRADVARGVELRHDHGSQYLTDYFQGQSRFHGFTPSFAFVGEPQTNGVVKRFNRTFKEQIIHGRTYKNREELAAALSAFANLYNREWRLEKLRYRSPLEARRDHENSLRLAA